MFASVSSGTGKQKINELLSSTWNSKITHEIVEHALENHLYMIHQSLIIHSNKIPTIIWNCLIELVWLFSMYHRQIHQPIRLATNHHHAREHIDRRKSIGKNRNEIVCDNQDRLVSTKMFDPDSSVLMRLQFDVVLIRLNVQCIRIGNLNQDQLLCLDVQQNRVVKNYR